MTSLQHAAALADARSCLAALADSARATAEAAHFEGLLIDLDALYADLWPALEPVDGPREHLLKRLLLAIDRLQDLGGDQLLLEVLIARALVGALT